MRARFAYYTEPFKDIPATASYFIVESENPKLPIHGNFSGEQLMEAGVGIPLTPVYRTWARLGKPVFRG